MFNKDVISFWKEIYLVVCESCWNERNKHCFAQHATSYSRGEEKKKLGEWFRSYYLAHSLPVNCFRTSQTDFLTTSLPRKGNALGTRLIFLTLSSLRSYIKIGITALAVLRHVVTAFNKRTCSSFCFIHSIPYFSSRHFLTTLSDKKLIDIKQFLPSPWNIHRELRGCPCTANPRVWAFFACHLGEWPYPVIHFAI